MTPRAVVVVGGSGVFGFRLAEGIVATTDLEVVIAGRDFKRAEAACKRLRRLHPAANVSARVLDTRSVTREDISVTGAWLVVDGAGPFQRGTYRLAEASIAAGAHYVDLADGRDFVTGIDALDGAARMNGVAVLSGASATPALSHAALRHLVEGWRAIDSVDVAIYPGNRAPRGTSVVRAVLSYVGQPVRAFIDGAWRQQLGWGCLVRRRIPGIGHRWLSLCETPDLELMPRNFQIRRAAIFRAGLELSVLHLGLSLFSLPVRAGLVRSLAPFAGILRAIVQLLRPLGSDRGGMSVSATGLDARGSRVEATWRLLATAAAGPMVPTLPALAAIRALHEGRLTWSGAGPGIGHLDLAAITAEMRRHALSTETAVLALEQRPLFVRALGARFEMLPETVRTAHDIHMTQIFEGRAEIEGAANPLGRLIARVLRFPHSGRDIAVRMLMAPERSGEAWRRDFGADTFHTHLSLVGDALIEEKFGAVTGTLRLQASPSGLDLETVGWRLGPVPLPKSLRPRSHARERIDAEGRFTFDVPITLPLIGRLVHYRGWLVPK